MSQQVNVYDVDGCTVLKTVSKPAVFDVELREDLVSRVHSLISNNSRQAYAVSPEAGMQHSAESWGTGRAIARVPRVKGGGTNRAGQAAFANFCRKGRLAHPTKTDRRFHKKSSLNERRTATAIAVAATQNEAIVQARGHKCSEVPMLPLVLSDKINFFEKTKEAVELLNRLGLADELEKVKNSKSLRKGKGKFRNRRFVKRKGLLVIHDNSELTAFKNIDGVEFMDINALNLYKLAPGGRLGRLVLWTESAFSKLDSVFGTFETESEVKSGYSLPLPMVTSDNLESYFYSPEVQSLISLPNLIPAEKVIRTDSDIANAAEFIAMYEKIVVN